MIYETGSIKGVPIFNEDIKIKTYCYVKREVDGQVAYLSFCDGEYEFTDLSKATPLSMKEAMQYVRYFRKKNISTSVFTSSKNSF